MDEHHYEQAERLAQRERDHAIAAHRRRRAALDRMPCTGWCADCDERIEPARLAAMPHARRCTECQSAHERRQ